MQRRDSDELIDEIFDNAKDNKYSSNNEEVKTLYNKDENDIKRLIDDIFDRSDQNRRGDF